MKYKAIILPSAKQDIAKITVWYEIKQAGLGKRFVVEIRSKIAFLKKDPYATNLKYDNVRTAVLNIFPFMVHYFIEDGQNAIIIISIFHTSRNPDLWAKSREE